MTTTIRVRASRAAVFAALRSLPLTCAGRTAAGGAAARTLLVRLGLQTLLTVEQAFRVKSAGGADASGLSWRPLAPLTVALKRAKADRPSDAILRDLDKLVLSLTPSTSPEQAGATPPKVRLQVFRLGRGRVTVGTRRQWARTHHKGSVAAKVPQRRLWPEVGNWPVQWWGGLLKQAREGVVGVLKHLLGAT